MTEGDTVPTLRKLPWLGGVNSYRCGGVSIPLGQQGWANEVAVVGTHPGPDERFDAMWGGQRQGWEASHPVPQLVSRGAALELQFLRL